MINHIRTLLLNEVVEESEDQEPRFRVDPAFSPVAVKASLAGIRSAYMAVASDLDGRMKVVDGLYKLVSRPDFTEFTRLFDERRTPVKDGAEMPESAKDAFGPGSSKKTLYGYTGLDQFDGALERLKAISSSSMDGEMRMAANVMAYVIQIEAARRVHG